ncbi:hypothetical protein ABRZ82_21690 [Vibrio vulnificus]|uniref:hypothetical protein n=1 Tax=Vibrio vulnificus TaxID=672 RepID=UPI0028CD6831|nr:hypothetical protein [Vibrio vulnificus]
MKDEVVFWFGLQASDVIAISAACIALISGVIALWQGWLMRRHNILSVTPHIDIAKSLIPGKPINMVMSNHGVGPAIIDEISFVKPDGSKIVLSTYESYESAFLSVGVELNSLTHLTRQLSSGTPIGTGKDIELFSVSHSDPSRHRQLIDIVEEMEFKVSYKCVYGKSYMTNSLVS